ncbi:MAG: hypothetical protein HYV28_08590, partial [Ignavibacteriales bacterium]|nr:hypothetical protein [Ignavibacteriales bacterium]
NVYDRPKMTDFKYEPDANLVYKVKYEHQPTLNLTQYKGLEVEIADLIVTDELVEAEIKKLMESHTTLVEAEVIEDENFAVDCEFKRVDDGGGHTIADDDRKPFPMNIRLYQEGIQPALKASLLNKKAGDTFEFSFEDKHQHTHEDGTHEDHNQVMKYDGVINKVSKVVFPETNEEFIKMISRNKANNIEEFREQMHRDYELFFQERMDEETEHKLEDKLIEVNPYTTPASFVERYHQNLIEERSKELKKQGKQYPREYLEKTLKPAAERFVKLYFIRKEVIKLENIQVNEEIMRAHAEENAKKLNFDAETLYKIYAGNEDMQETVLRQEYLKFLKSNNTIIKVELKKDEH